MRPHERWNLADFLEQIRKVRALPSLDDLIRHIPAAKRSSIPEVSWDEVRQAEAIILSMTPKERRIPEQIDASRVRRIARGSGTSESDVLHLLRDFRQMRRQ
jgi:signal recognition particle subunit SRP54